MSGIWSRERCIASAREYTGITEWKNAQGGAYAYALKHGYKDECVAHMERKHKPKSYWTLEMCKKSAQKYTTRSQWAKWDSTIYHRALEEGWFDECTAHMIEKQKPNGYWTYEKCLAFAVLYPNANLWRLGHSKSYEGARRKKYLVRIRAQIKKVDKKSCK